MGAARATPASKGAPAGQRKAKRRRLEAVPADAGDAYDFTRQVGHMLRKAYQAHIAIFQALSANPEVTPAQFAVLCAVMDCAPCSLAVVGRRVVMDPATTRGIIERLGDRGLVSVARDAADRRRVIVSLTREGVQVLKRMVPAAERISQATVKKLSPAEQVALRYLLEKVCAAGAEATNGKETPADEEA